MLVRIVSVFVFVLVALGAGSARAESGLQITPDGKRTLISKDVGAERWAITLNTVGGIITGNVFESAGGAPKFIDCQQERVANGEVFLACRGADPCLAGPCTPESWTTIPGEIGLPISFFQPPASGAGAAGGGAAEPAAEARESGIQITPDQTQVLVSKDVGGERWAITRHAEDLTVTGNVFAGAGSAPKFVWCEQTGSEGGNVTIDCRGANRCEAAPCGADQWTVIGAVTLPLSFFEAPPAP